MSKKRLVLAGVMLTALAVIGFGCGGSDDSSDGGANPLVGTWRVTTFTVAGVDFAPETIMTLVISADGTVVGTEIDGGETDVDTGTWTAADGIVTMSWEATVEDPAEVQTLPYTLNGNTLAVTQTEVDDDTGQPITVTVTLTRM